MFQNFNNLLISCDMQNIYASGVPFSVRNFVEYLHTFKDVLYLFNNYKIGVEDTKDTIIEMLKTDGFATDEDISNITFQPKQYWYFRDLLDNENISYKDVVKLLKLMILRGVENAYNLSYNDLKSCIFDNYIVGKIQSGNIVVYYDPKLAFTLSQYSGATLVGGFEFQCLIEICVYLDALDIPYEKNYKFIY